MNAQGIKSFFGKRSVALGLTALTVLGCLTYGWTQRETGYTPALGGGQTEAQQLPLSQDGGGYQVYDEAGVLSAETETLLGSYNRRWESEYGSVVAVAAVDGTGGEDIEEYAYRYGNDAGLGSNDMLLLIDTDADACQFVTSYSEIIPDQVVEDAYYDRFDGQFRSGNTEEGLRQFFAEMDGQYARYAGTTEAGSQKWSVFLGVAVIAFSLIMMISVIDRARYRSWQRRADGRRSAVRAFTPLLFWHGAGSAWARRRDAEFHGTFRSARPSGMPYRGGSSFGSGSRRGPSGGSFGGSSFGSRGSSGGSSFGSRGGFGSRR